MKTYFLALSVLALTLLAHIMGMDGLYMQYYAYDVFMHMLGGVGIGLFVKAILDVHYPKLPNKRKYIIWGAFIAGILWEFFEAYYNIAGYPLWTKKYYLDTIKDLIDDSVGGLLVAMLFSRK